MTDTTDTSAHGTPNEGESQINADQAPAEDQRPSDPDSDEQLQREADQREQEAEAERLAVLDLETEADKAGTPLDAAVWGSTGHAGADEALRTLQNSGLSTDDAVEFLLDAALTRDPGKVDQKALAAKIGPRRTKAIMASLEAYSREMRPKDERMTREVYQHTNGPHALQRLIDQASAKLPMSEVQGYIIQMAKGGSSAQRAVETLQSIVAGGSISLDRRVHTEQYSAPKPVPAPKATTGISSKDYVAALQALHSPGSRLSFEARDRREAELHEARRIGRQNGLH